MALPWLLLSVRCTKKQHTTLWWHCRGFCSVSDVQKNNIQHCDGFVVASAQCQMYKKTTYNTVMALSWLLLSVRCTKKQHTTLWWLCRGFCSVSDVQKNNIQHCDGYAVASAQCQMYKKQYTTLWWLCHGFCSVSDVQTTIYNTVMALSWLCHGFCSVSDVQKNNIEHCDGFVMASAQCQMYKKTIYTTVMDLSWLLLSVRCTNNNIQHMALAWLLLSVRCTIKQHTTRWWLCHGFCSVSDIQKNLQHCDGFGMASAQCQMYKKSTYNTVMALSWLLLSVRCTKKQYTTLWWLCRGFCSVSDVQKNNIQQCDGFVMASAQCQMYKQQYTTLWWLCHGFVMASALCQMYKKTI